jgi:hypothetical protein
MGMKIDLQIKKYGYSAMKLLVTLLVSLVAAPFVLLSLLFYGIAKCAKRATKKYAYTFRKKCLHCREQPRLLRYFDPLAPLYSGWCGKKVLSLQCSCKITNGEDEQLDELVARWNRRDWNCTPDMSEYTRSDEYIRKQKQLSPFE